MEHAVLVGVLHGIREGDYEGRDVAPLSGVGGTPVCQRAAGGEFHGEEWEVVHLIHAVDRQDGRVLQCRHSPGFLTKAFAHSLLIREARAQHLQCDGAVRLTLPGAVNHPHAAPCDLLEDLMPRHPHGGHTSGGRGLRLRLA